MRNRTGKALLLFKGIIFSILVLVWGWGCLALFFSGPDPIWLKTSLTCFFALLLPGTFLFSRSFSRPFTLCLVFLGTLLLWWQTLEPTNNKEWASDVARISHGEIRGDTLVMHNVRNFRYEKDGKILEERWETREYDLNTLQGLDLFLSYWGSEHIAHTILSWDFGDGGHLAISIETRKDKTQNYSAIKGFFKQFELSYVAADEKDLIGLRTNFRKERVYGYRLITSTQRPRALLESYLTEMNKLVDNPQFYNALTQNCTTTIQLHNKAIDPKGVPSFDWRIIASGHVDELLYERALLVQSIPFTELKQKSRIDLLMQLKGKDQFSRILRSDLPKP
jgi:hypothetical protein